MSVATALAILIDAPTTCVIHTLGIGAIPRVNHQRIVDAFHETRVKAVRNIEAHGWIAERV